MCRGHRTPAATRRESFESQGKCTGWWYTDAKILAMIQRILGLDIGDKRIGIALSDELGLTAQPIFTLHRSTPRADLKSIARMVRKHKATALVAGLPLHMSGDPSPQAKKARAFAEELAQITGLPLSFQDERLTSREAEEILRNTGRTGAEHKHLIDQLAAALILQDFLDAKQNATRAAGTENL